MRQIDGHPTCAHPSFQLPSSPPSLMQACLSHLAIARALLMTVRSRVAAAPAAGQEISDGPFAWISDSPPDQPLQTRNALEPIAALKMLLDKSGTKLLVTTSPVRWQVVETPEHSELSRRWEVRGLTPFASRMPFETLERFCRQHGLRFLNAEAAFRAVEQPEKLFSDHAPVPSNPGLALYAHVLAKFLTENPPSYW